MKNTISILLILQKAAQGHTDPKPGLQDSSNFKTTKEAYIAQKLARKIEEYFSQIEAIHQTPEMELTPSQISLLRIAESCGQLYEGYDDVIGELQATETHEEEPEKLEKNDLQEFLNAILTAANDDFQATLERLKNSTTSVKLRKSTEKILSTMKEDGKTLGQAVKDTKTCNVLITRAIEFGEKAKSLPEVLRPIRESLRHELNEGKSCLKDMEKTLQEKGINWKVALVTIGGLAVVAKMLSKK